MQFSMKLYLVALLGMAPSVLQAKIQKNVCIKHIGNIFQHLPENLPNDGSVIAVLDWDRTISEIEGEPKAAETYKPREEGNDEHAGTLATIKNLQDRAIKTMVVTARMQGLGARGGSGLSSEAVIALANRQAGEMLKFLGGEWKLRGPIIENNMHSDDIQGSEAARISKLVGRPLQFMAVNQIVFAPGEVKGEVVKQYIDENKFSTKPTHIIFIDNKLKNIEAFEQVFKDRPEHVYLFNYPDTEPKPQKTGTKPVPDLGCPKA